MEESLDCEVGVGRVVEERGGDGSWRSAVVRRSPTATANGERCFVLNFSGGNLSVIKRKRKDVLSYQTLKRSGALIKY